MKGVESVVICEAKYFRGEVESNLNGGGNRWE